MKIVQTSKCSKFVHGLFISHCYDRYNPSEIHVRRNLTAIFHNNCPGDDSPGHSSFYGLFFQKESRDPLTDLCYLVGYFAFVLLAPEI